MVTAHNLAFDAAFLAAEWAGPVSTGRSAPVSARSPSPGRCTPVGEGYSLAACSAAAGIDQPEAHRALADTRVTADLLASLLDSIPTGRRPWPRRRLRFG